MPIRDDLLREETYKEENLEVSKRVFYTLKTEHRVAKGFALLVERLHKQGVLTDSDIDDLLLDCVDQ